MSSELFKWRVGINYFLYYTQQREYNIESPKNSKHTIDFKTFSKIFRSLLKRK